MAMIGYQVPLCKLLKAVPTQPLQLWTWSKELPQDPVPTDLPEPGASGQHINCTPYSVVLLCQCLTSQK